MIDSILLILFSFAASFGFGIVFRIEKKYLVLAGISGALTRFIYLLLLQFISESFIYNFLAATAAALFAELMAIYTKNPSTVFLYPSIIPLIPGGALYYSVVGLMLQSSEYISEYLALCIHSLAGLGLGFVTVSIIMHYKRRYLRIVRRRKALAALKAAKKAQKTHENEK
ncbi:MAG: threonine/serine exporter family protein [Clostridiales bacterium]|nr:threonine/serine exporter family protein [Clostridiales bacterium]